MPLRYSSRPDGWREEMNAALNENEHYSLYTSKKPNRHRSLVEDIEPSENDFVKGFMKRQTKTKRNGFVEDQTKPSKSPASSGYEQRRLEKSTENKSFSGKGFLKGFLEHGKSETDPYDHETSKLNLYEKELLRNSDDHNKRSPLDTRAHCTKKPSSDQVDSPEYLRQRFASIQTPSPSTRYSSTRSKPYTATQRVFDEQEWPETSTEQTRRLPQYARKPSTPSIKTPSPSTRYSSTYECRKLSEAEWKKLEEKSQHEQKEFLDQYEGEFKSEPVSYDKKNVKRGDHIVCKGAIGDLYYHHLLCIGVDGDHIDVIEYTGPSVGLAAISQTVATSNILAFAAIKRGTLSYDILKEKEAKIRKWPKELERYSVDEVIARALSRLRKKEQDYHAFDNNCEHFVNWCKCGLSTSLQVKPWHKPTWNGVKAVGSGALHGLQKYGVSNGVPAFLKAVGNVSDEILGSISSPLSPVGFAVGGVIETGFAAWNIYQDYKRKKEGRISESQFKINSVATASKAAFHIAGGVTGSVMGSVVGPLGSIFGGAIGYGVGHVVGSAVGYCYEHAPKVKKAFQENVIAPVKKVVNTCVNAVKSAGRAVWEGVKSVFSSLFSWW